MIELNPQRSDELVEELLKVWDASVRVTHLFLTEYDISSITPYVCVGIDNTEKLFVVYEQNKAVGFMGLYKDKIEMLFLHPSCHRKGLGRKLVKLAISEHNIQFVDVNEQNTHATDFYKAMGFIVFSRSELDDGGNSFPILHMQQQG